jgi:NAD(P)H-nitrite reductase large subunit
MNLDDTELLICRCEEVTKGQILDAIQNGAHSLWQIRRMTRCGLGLCQGRSCEQLAARILAEALHVPIESVLLPSRRPPVRPLTIDVLASGERIELE